MADVQAARYTTEILAAAGNMAGVTRQGLQTVLARLGAGTATVQAPRFATEILAKFPARASVTRQGNQIVLPRIGVTTATMFASRYSQETLMEVPAKLGVTRQGLQTVLARPGANLTANMRSSRYALEVLGRSFIPMTSFAVPAGWDLFLHNWAKRSTLESAYRTDITASAEDLSEERTAQIQKPYRELSVQWTIKGKDEVNQMLTELRRLVDETSVVPLYMHKRELTQQANSGQPFVFADVETGLFFPDGPVVIFKMKPTMDGTETTRVEAFETAIIKSPFGSNLELKANLSNTYPASRSFVMPLIQTHPQVEISIAMLTNRLFRIDATFDEIYGENALPPSATDLPSNFDSYNDIPILSTVPEWSDGIVQTLRREGSQDALGRGRVVYQRGARHRVIHELTFRENRLLAWDLIRFFDTRRGRLSPFWVIDFENIYTVALISNPNVTVSANVGTLAEFQAEMEHVGLIFSDGRAVVRRATNIAQIGGAWRIILDQNIPDGYTAADVVAFGRARLCRMQKDALKEEWDTTNVCALSVPVVELLAEQEVTP